MCMNVKMESAGLNSNWMIFDQKTCTVIQTDPILDELTQIKKNIYLKNVCFLSAYLFHFVRSIDLHSFIFELEFNFLSL